MKWLIEITKNRNPKSGYQVVCSQETLNIPVIENGKFLCPGNVGMLWNGYNIGQDYKAKLVFVDADNNRHVMARKIS